MSALGRMLLTALLGLTAGVSMAAGPAAPKIENPTPNDFARGLELRVPEGQPVVEMALPPEVYRGVTRRDLGDLGTG